MIKGQKLCVEAPLFPTEIMRITQEMNGQYSHRGTMNIDLGGKAGIVDPVFAPSEIKVAAIPTGQYHEVVYESTKPVLWADGSYDFYTMYLLHDNDITDLKVGKVFAQGEKIYDEGGFGPKGPRTYAAHIHIGVARGKYAGKVKNVFGVWELKNEVEPYKLFWVNGTQIINGAGYPWKTL